MRVIGGLKVSHPRLTFAPWFLHNRFTEATLRTVAIASDDHRLMPITKQTTKLDGSLRLRSFIVFVLPTVWAITSAEITVSIALKTAADSMTGQMKENSLSCIGSNSYLRGKIFILKAFSLKQEVLEIIQPSPITVRQPQQV
jgi:hypothetical protein